MHKIANFNIGNVSICKSLLKYVIFFEKFSLTFTKLYSILSLKFKGRFLSYDIWPKIKTIKKRKTFFTK